jgi:hypothetical protein
MGISKYMLYKYVKVDGTWRYCKAAYHDNGKIKLDIVFVKVKEGLLEKHPEGRYYLSHNGGWIDAGNDALEAQRKRKQRLALDEFKRLSGKGSADSSVVLADNQGRTTLAAAAEKYFENCEARGLDPESIRKYRAAVDPFVEHCGVTYVGQQAGVAQLYGLFPQPAHIRRLNRVYGRDLVNARLAGASYGPTLNRRRKSLSRGSTEFRCAVFFLSVASHYAQETCVAWRNLCTEECCSRHHRAGLVESHKEAEPDG